MKPATLLLAMLLAIPAASAASAQSVRFEGYATITGFTGTCADYDPTGSEYVVRYRPAGVGANPANSGLSFFDSAGAYNYTPTGKFTTTFKAVTESDIFDYAGSQPDSRVRFLTQSPATVAPTTDFINVTGQVDNFDFMAGCRAEFLMSVARRP